MSELEDNLQEESQEVTEATPSDILGNKKAAMKILPPDRQVEQDKEVVDLPGKEVRKTDKTFQTLPVGTFRIRLNDLQLVHPNLINLFPESNLKTSTSPESSAGRL